MSREWPCGLGQGGIQGEEREAGLGWKHSHRRSMWGLGLLESKGVSVEVAGHLRDNVLSVEQGTSREGHRAGKVREA